MGTHVPHLRHQAAQSSSQGQSARAIASTPGRSQISTNFPKCHTPHIIFIIQHHTIRSIKHQKPPYQVVILKASPVRNSGLSPSEKLMVRVPHVSLSSEKPNQWSPHLRHLPPQLIPRHPWVQWASAPMSPFNLQWTSVDHVSWVCTSIT